MIQIEEKETFSGRYDHIDIDGEFFFLYMASITSGEMESCD